MMALLVLLLLTQAFTGNVLARWFDCRRPGQGCSQGRSCQSDGTCDCLDGVSSADCRYSSPGYYDGGTLCTDDLQCAAGSKTCFNSSLTHVAEACACQDGFHGDKCQLPRAGIQCWGDRVALSLIPRNFIGKIYPLESLMGNGSQDTCYLMPIRLQATNPDLAAFSFGFGHSRLFQNDPNPCLADPVATEQSDKVVYQMKYLIQYNDNYLANYDEVITVECHVAKFPTGPITMTVDLDPAHFSMLLQHHRHEQSIENFNMVVTYDNGTLVGSDDLLPIGTSLVANVSLTDHSSKDVTDRRSVLVHLHPEYLLDLFINECDIRPAEDDSQNAIIIYKDGCVIQRYGLDAGDPSIRGYFWVKFLLPRFPQSPNLVLSCAVVGCETSASCQKARGCVTSRTRREEERFPVQPETREKQRLSWLLRVESDLPMTGS
ncbi:uncharacterized protein LOC112558109 isoform X2 [Pomacea canaliculata]|uniref:uncharacterized protein LOC112558109 isoform X2 n=1 Tax=Pomacea canaliculata TaxID=400727 RepID=UPI000D731839|nr:uncharacterized protein LOC112558109 isoform X2 [Pomacea canaliculata]